MTAAAAGLRIDRLTVGDEDRVGRAGHLFDHVPRPDTKRRFLADPGHHLLATYRAAGATAAGDQAMFEWAFGD